jgi:hypothetical protein
MNRRHNIILFIISKVLLDAVANLSSGARHIHAGSLQG